MDIYKQVLFQIRIDQSHYFGILTYHFLKYSYLDFMIEKCDENGEYNYYKSKSDKINDAMTQYISSFVNQIVNGKEYEIYCIAEIGNEKSTITFDKRISVDFVIDEKAQKLHFLDQKCNGKDFEKIQEKVYQDHNIWDFIDYYEDEKPFTEEIQYDDNSDDENDSDEDSDGDEDGEDKRLLSPFMSDCKKYENMYTYYSKDFRKKRENDAYKKRKFWYFVRNKMKNEKCDQEVIEYCKLREATQCCREFLYTGYNLFRIRHLFICDSIHITNEECHIVDIQNNDHLEVTIDFTLKIKDTEEYTGALVCRKGCYDSGIYNSYEVSELQGVDPKKFESLFDDLFGLFCPSYIYT